MEVDPILDLKYTHSLRSGGFRMRKKLNSQLVINNNINKSPWTL